MISKFQSITFVEKYINQSIYYSIKDMFNTELKHIHDKQEIKTLKELNFQDNKDDILNKLEKEEIEMNRYLDYLERSGSNEYVEKLSKHAKKYQILVDKILNELKK